MEEIEKQLRKDFQDFADSIIWTNDTGDEKYIGVGNMADWWIDKFSTSITKLLEERTEEIRQVVLNCIGLEMNDEFEDFFERFEKALEIIKKKI